MRVGRARASATHILVTNSLRLLHTPGPTPYRHHDHSQKPPVLSLNTARRTAPDQRASFPQVNAVATSSSCRCFLAPAAQRRKQSLRAELLRATIGQ
jgi:hypothetical protein